MRSLAKALLVAAVIGLAPSMLSPSLPSSPPTPSDPGRRTSPTARPSSISACASCHATPGQDNRMRLGGGLALKSPFVTFKVPNISSDANAGIGAWTEAQFANAILKGVGRNGEHLYPSLPYTSYQRMPLSDARVPQDAAARSGSVSTACADVPIQRPAADRPLEAALSGRKDLHTGPYERCSIQSWCVLGRRPRP